MTPPHHATQHRSIGRWVLAIGVAGIILCGLVLARVSPDAIISQGERLVAEVRGLGMNGVALFAVLQIIVALTGILPASLLAVAAGAVYGIFAGFLLSVVTTMTGANLAFLLSRSLFRPGISQLLSKRKRLRDFDNIIADDGWKIVCLLRISPIMPFSATSYMFGLSKIGRRDYLIGTLASLPALLGYVTMGALANTGLAAWGQKDSPIRTVLLVAGGFVTIALIIWLARIVVKARLAQ